MTDITVKTVTGSGIVPFLDDVARLRIEVFSEFPYLYDGDMEYERRYLKTYAQSPESLFVLAFDREKVIGASTGVPMADETDEFKEPFAKAGFDPEKIFYYGESVLDGNYRGHGLGVKFFQEREAFARTLGRFDWCAFCAVDRDFDDPRKPPGYIFLNDFWIRRGFVRYSHLNTSLIWKELGEEAPTAKSMTFWLKKISGG